MDWLVGEVVDLFTTSHAEGQSKKFKKLVKFLDKKISSLEREIDDGRAQIGSIHDKFSTEMDAAEGQIMTTFTSKEGEWYSKADGVVRKFEQALSDIRMKRSEAQRKAEYWEEQARLEDQRRRQALAKSK